MVATVLGIVGSFRHLEIQPVRNSYSTTWIKGAFIPARGAAAAQIDIGIAEIQKGFADVKTNEQIFQIDVILNISTSSRNDAARITA